jgi:hypothetical protein
MPPGRRYEPASHRIAGRARMTARVRKAIGGLGILVFLGVYVWAAATLGSHLPNQWAIRLIYYAVVGTSWGLPIIPLISWMNRGR